jgi:hypothetical protein
MDFANMENFVTLHMMKLNFSQLKIKINFINLARIITSRAFVVVDKDVNIFTMKWS